MSLHALRFGLERPKLSLYERMTLLYICEQYDEETKVSIITENAIAKKCGCRAKLINEYTIKLRKRGLIVPTKPKGGFTLPLYEHIKIHEVQEVIPPVMKVKTVTKIVSYDAYLKSEQWQGLRALILERADNKCQVCSAGEELNVHHNTYERFGRELLTDLVVLCKECHRYFHERDKEDVAVKV